MVFPMTLPPSYLSATKIEQTENSDNGATMHVYSDVACTYFRKAHFPKYAYIRWQLKCFFYFCNIPKIRVVAYVQEIA